MKFLQQYQPWLAAAKDDSRPTLTCVNVQPRELPDSDHGLMVATDGYILTVLPCELDPEDVAGLVPAEVLKQAAAVSRKVIRKTLFTQLTLEQDRIILQDGTILPRRHDYGTFPDYQRIVPQEHNSLELVAFNGEYASTIAKAFGVAGLTLRMGKSGECPITVLPIDRLSGGQWPETLEAPYAILMPVHVAGTSTAGLKPPAQQPQEPAVELREVENLDDNMVDDGFGEEDEEDEEAPCLCGAPMNPEGTCSVDNCVVAGRNRDEPETGPEPPIVTGVVLGRCPQCVGYTYPCEDCLQAAVAREIEEQGVCPDDEPDDDRDRLEREVEQEQVQQGTAPARDVDRILVARFRSACILCDVKIKAGDEIRNKRGVGASHVECPKDAGPSKVTGDSFYQRLMRTRKQLARLAS